MSEEDMHMADNSLRCAKKDITHALLVVNREFDTVRLERNGLHLVNMALEAQLQAQQKQVGDLTALVARLAHSLRQAAPGNDLPEKAVDYLKRNGLDGSPLREL